MTTTTKRNLVLFGLDTLTFVIGFAGILYVIGSAGALEHFAIDCSQFFVRSLIGIGFVCLAFIVYKVRMVMLKYFRYTSKNNKK
jgi:hypothetical protein